MSTVTARIIYVEVYAREEDDAVRWDVDGLYHRFKERSLEVDDEPDLHALKRRLLDEDPAALDVQFVGKE
jgi:hypothetical protein